MNKDIRYIKLNPLVIVNIDFYESKQARMDEKILRTDRFNISEDTMNKIKEILYNDVKSVEWITDIKDV